MIKYRLTGSQLAGELTIAGRKNAALPLIAGSLLTTGTVTLNNVPEIADVTTMLDILEALGATVERSGQQVKLNTAAVGQSAIPYDLGRRLRGSILFLGPLLARFGQVELPHPGGCIIGKRPVGLHFDVLAALGASFETTADSYRGRAAKLAGAEIFLSEASVTGTENALMAAALATGQTTVVNAAHEDHIRQLADLLTALGYRVKGVGGATVTIGGGDLSDHDAELTVIPDEIELGTFIVAALVTNSALTLRQVGDHQSTLPIRATLERFGAVLQYNEADQSLFIKKDQTLRPATVTTGVWPGIPTDLQPPLALLATQIAGNTLIHDWMYEGRFTYVAGLEKMGARILTCDPHRILVQGKTPLLGTDLTSPDLRAGATQLMAALAAKGQSVIDHAELIERGYERLDERLRAVGATIERLEED